jgi:SAM-dependent methyltransferase
VRSRHNSALPRIRDLRLILGATVVRPYDPLAPGYSDRMSWDARRLGQVRAIVRRAKPSGRVLDIGASPYFLTAALAADGYDVTVNGVPVRNAPDAGILELDTSKGHVVATAALYDAEGDFPHSDETFDVIVAGEVFEHFFRAPWHFLQESWRCLAPDGALVLTTPNGHSLEHGLSWLKRGATGMGFNPHWPSTRHAREYSVGELRDLLLSQGFQVDRLFTANHYLIPRSGFRGFGGPIKFCIYRAAKSLATRSRGPLASRATEIVVVARKLAHCPPGEPPAFMLYGGEFVLDGKTFSDAARGT